VLLGIVGVGSAAVVVIHHHDTPTTTTTTLTPAQAEQLRQQEAAQRTVEAAEGLVGVALPDRFGAEAPPLSASGFRHPLSPHQVVGFLPYWYLGDPGSVDLQALSTVAYYAIGINADGSLQESGSGWADIGDSAFQQLVSSAHQAGVRVLLTVSTDDETILDAISASPADTARTLLSSLVGVVKSNDLDGVDLDLEGRNGADQAGFARFVHLVSQGLHAANATWDVMIDTYPQSASDPDDFFDIEAIAPSVDQIFVMAYDMYSDGVPSANSPLTGASISVVAALQTYTAIVPPSKLVLGVPFYGADWTLPQGYIPGYASAPVSLTYSTIAGSGHQPLWDPTTDTVFFSYRYQGNEHETWFDDPLTLALKAALAQEYRVGGVGVWALGMDGAGSGMLPALLGGAQPLREPLATGG
jgi:hypothetical protein